MYSKNAPNPLAPIKSTNSYSLENTEKRKHAKYKMPERMIKANDLLFGLLLANQAIIIPKEIPGKTMAGIITSPGIWE
ncbi:MAG: hypothetical protein ACHQHN_09155 [Sphingobacteriales bacterium]